MVDYPRMLKVASAQWRGLDETKWVKVKKLSYNRKQCANLGTRSKLTSQDQLRQGHVAYPSETTFFVRGGRRNLKTKN